MNEDHVNMQKDKSENAEADELNAHYDFDYSQAKPNRFAARLAQEQLMVVLDADVAAIFPISEAVNEALRVYWQPLPRIFPTPVQSARASQ